MGTIEAPGNPQEEDRSLEKKSDLLNLDMKWTYAEQKAKFVSKLESISALNWNASDQALKKSFEANVRFVKTTKGKDRYVAQYDWVDFAYIKANEKTQLTQFIYTFVSDLQQELSNKTTLNGNDHAEIWVKTNTILSLLDLQAEIKNTNQEQDSKKDNRKDLKDVTKSTRALEKENKREEELNQVTAWLMIEKLKQVKNTLDATEIKSLIDQMDKVLLQLDGMQTELDSKQVNDADAQAFGLKYIQLFEQYIGLHKWVIDYLRTQQRLNRIQFPKELAWMDDGSQVWKMRERRMQKAAKLAKKDIKSDLKFDKTYPWIFWSTVPTSRIDQLQQNGKKAKGPNVGNDDVYDDGVRVDSKNITGAEVVWMGGVAGSVELGETRAPNITNNPKYEAGKDGIVRKENLRTIPLEKLIGYYRDRSDEDMSLDTQQVRSALLYRMIKSGSVAPQLSTGATIEHVPFGDALKMLWNGDPKKGISDFWKLMEKAMIDSSFKSKMNADVTRTLQLAQAAKAEDWRDTRQSFLYDYFELTNPQERSAIILNAFVKNLAPVLGARFDDSTLQPASLRYMFDMYKDGKGVLDYEQAAQDIERATWELGNATTMDVFKKQGLPGLVRTGLVALVEKGAISTETAANIARGTDAVMNIAQTGFAVAGIWHGAKSAWKFVTSWFKKWDEAKKARSESWDALKMAAGFGLGGYYGMQVLKDPSSWNKIPLVGSLYALFDKDYANEQHKKDFIDNHNLRSVTTEAKILNDTIGSLTIQQLKDQGVLVKQWTNGVAINKDNFIKLVPALEEYKTMWASALSQFIQNLNKSLVNEYQLTWTKVEEYAATGKTLPDILKSIAETKADIKRFKDAVGSGVWDSSFDNVFESGTDAEKTALKEKLAFAAQQVNKLNNKDGVWAKYIADTMNITNSATKAKLEWALVNAMNQTDANGVTGRAFITAKLREALVSGDPKEYFKAVAVVMSNKTTFPTQADALYMNPAIASGTAPTPDFVSFIHEPTIGNAPAGGTDYFPTPTLGAGDYADNANNYASLSAPTTNKWEEIMGEL
jgi:hypothetical protein